MMEIENNVDEKKRRLRMLFLMVFALLASTMVILTACSNATQTGKVTNSAQVPNGAAAGVDNPVMTKDTKTAAQQTQEQVAALIPDGMYEKVVSYNFPRGVNQLDIKITVSNDVVTEASVAGVNPDPMSNRFQTGFNAALPNLVVGKKIEDINLPKQVAGSSLTTAAFAQYLNSLKSA